jgi:hypothetical protein
MLFCFGKLDVRQISLFSSAISYIKILNLFAQSEKVQERQEWLGNFIKY